MNMIETLFANTMEIIKTLFAESLDNLLVAGSCLFIILSFFTAIAEPKAALLTLAVSVGFYAAARFTDKA